MTPSVRWSVGLSLFPIQAVVVINFLNCKKLVQRDRVIPPIVCTTCGHGFCFTLRFYFTFESELVSPLVQPFLHLQTPTQPCQVSKISVLGQTKLNRETCIVT